MSNCLDPDQDRCSVGPHLGPNCLQRFSADDKVATGRNELKGERNCSHAEGNCSHAEVIRLQKMFDEIPLYYEKMFDEIPLYYALFNMFNAPI